MTTRRLVPLAVAYGAGLVAYAALGAGPSRLALGMSLRAAQPLLVVWGVRRQRPAAPAVWWLLAGGVACGGIGDTLTDVSEWAVVPGPLVVTGQVMQAVCYALVLTAAGLVVRHRSPSINGDSVLDVASTTVAGGIVLWEALSGQLLPSRMADPGARLMAIGLVLMLSGVLVLAVRQVTLARRAPQSLLVLVAAVLAAMSGNVVLLLFRHGAFSGGGVVGACWLLGGGLVGVAALLPSMRELTEPAPARDPRLTRLRVALLGVSMSVVPGILVLEGLRHKTVSAVPLGFGATVLLGLVATRVVRAVQAREAAVRERQRGERRLRAMVQHSLDGIAVLAPDGTITFLAGGEGLVSDDIGAGTNIFEWLDGGASVYLRALVADAVTDPGRLVRGQVRLQGAGGERWMEVLLSNRLGDAAVDGVLVNFRDVTERHAAEQELAHRAMHDALTGLPNRSLLLDRLAHALASARRTGQGVAVLFCDIDRFKVINDSRGHDAGDELLVAVSKRLRARLRASDTLARFGGDEFVLLCENLGSELPPLELLESVLAAFSEPFLLSSGTVTVSTSIGVTVAGPTDPRTPDALLRDADAAMYRAKSHGRNRWEAFDLALRAGAVARLETELELRDALEREELVPFFQPVVHIGSGRVVGLEALARWRHPRRGLVMPGEFLSVAEDSGLVVPVGDLMLAAGCRQVAAWRGQPHGEHLTVSVNVTDGQLRRPDAFERIADTLREHGLPGAALTLEITERTLVQHDGPAAAALRALRAIGVRVALDDFGTGYSSLSYLRDFELDVLKIDRSFVARLERSTEDRAVAVAIVDLARALSLDVVGEGVETDSQLRLLADMGCGFAQGFRISPPMPAAAVDLAAWAGQQTA